MIFVSDKYTPGFALIALSLITLIYVIARTEFYKVSKLLTLFTVSMFSLILMAFATEPLHFTIAWLSIPGLAAFAWLSYPRLITIVATVFQAVSIKSIILLQSNDPFFTLNAILLTTLLLVSVCTLIYLQWYYGKHLTAQRLQSIEREEQFRKILDEIPAMISVRSEGQFLYINPYGAKLLERDEADITGQSLQDFIVGDLETSLPDMPHSSTEDRIQLHHTFQYRTVDNTTKSLTEVAIPIAYNDRLATLGIASPQLDTSSDRVSSPDQHISDYMTEVIYSVRYEHGHFQVNHLTGHCLSLNKQLLQMLFQLDLTYPLYTDDKLIVRDALDRLLKQDVVQFQQRLFFKGKVCHIEHTLTPIFTTRGDLVEIYGRAHDKTEYVYLENALETHTVQQAVIAELGLLALSGSDILHLLNHSLMLCQQLLGMSVCDFFLFDASQQVFNLAASTLYLNREIPQYALSTFINMTPAEIFSQYNPTLLYASEIQRLPDYLQGRNIRAGLSMSIQHQNRDYALLNVYSDDIDYEFSNDDIYFIQSIVNILGTYLSHRYVQAEELRQRQYSIALQNMIAMLNSKSVLSDVLDAVLDCVAKVVPAHEMSSIFLRNNSDEDFVCVSSQGYKTIRDGFRIGHLTEKDSLIPGMVDTHKAITIPDVRDISDWVQVQDEIEIRAYLGAAIFIEDVCIGLLNVDSTQVDVFTDEDAARLETFVHHIGIAIQNARQHEIMEQHVRERTLALKQRQDQLQAILGATGEGIFYTEGMTIQVVNKEFCRITGFTEGELVGQSSTFLQPDDITEDEQQRLRFVGHSIQKDNIWRGDVRLKHKTKESFYAGLTIAVAGQRDDGTLLAVTIVCDVSERKQLEQMKNRFISSAAHELRNPVMNFNLRMYRIRRQQHVTPNDIDVLDRVVKRMNRLVGDLLDFEQLERRHILLKQEPLILQDVIQDVLTIQSTYADEQTIILHNKMPETPVYVFADPVRLEQVFTNLVANAIAYTSEQGSVSISVIGDLTTSSEKVDIVIQDTGIGIPEDKLNEVFQPFIRVHDEHKATGTGLGLSITREIILLHDGNIRVESKVDEGSRFIVTLPVMQVLP
ncbi:MAG: ATP-binding protein [Aggregatilineales bacterium]